MNSLIVDTATKNLYISLIKDDVVLDEYINNESREHSKNIMPEIENILIKNNVDIKEINRIYVGIGPGSYTGVRIGVTVCKMLAWTLNIPLYEFSSLYLMGSNLTNKAVLIDARRGNAFCAEYENDKCIIPEALRSIDEFKELIKYNIIDEDSFNPNPINIMKASKEVNPHTCVPNYLRDTEAERNLRGDK